MGEVAAQRPEWVIHTVSKDAPREAVLPCQPIHPLSHRAPRADSSPIEGEQKLITDRSRQALISAGEIFLELLHHGAC
jgi:hypothetical protein